jgi:coenzyme F420 biosynthesis associated uncharacterized protein
VVEVIDWSTAESVAVRSVGREPFSQSYHYASLQPDFVRFPAEAEAAVAAETGLVSAAGPARARVTDRAGWVRANVASFRRLLRPLSDRLGERMAAGPAAPFARRVAGAELGMFLGWMSRRVLGQYDLLVIEDENPEDQDIVYFVGPNVLGLERRFGFPPDEFRLWLALHELTHRAQFTGVPWLREHFLGLVSTTFSALDPDPSRVLRGLNLAVEEFRKGRNPLDDGGIAVLFASPEQREALDHLSGMMSLLEGHGDVTMNRAGAAEIPSSDRFHRILHARRNDVNPMMKLIQKLIGLEAKMKQYQAGEEFIEAVEEVGGRSALDRAFEAPGNLPTLAEIRAPGEWLQRMGLDRAAVVTA